MKQPRFSVNVGRDGLQLDIDALFWDDTIVKTDGTTQLDINIAAVTQEIKLALYYVATDGTKH